MKSEMNGKKVVELEPRESEAQNGFDEWMWQLDRTLYGRSLFEEST